MKHQRLVTAVLKCQKRGVATSVERYDLERQILDHPAIIATINGQVIGFHHVCWSSTKSVAIADGNANQVIINDSDFSPSIREEVVKWAKGFDSNKLQTIGQSKKVIDFQKILDTNPNE